MEFIGYFTHNDRRCRRRRRFLLNSIQLFLFEFVRGGLLIDLWSGAVIEMCGIFVGELIIY